MIALTPEEWERARNADAPALPAHVGHLTAEHARLREGIEGLIRSNWWTGEVHVDDLRALLSPPTEEVDTP